MRDTNLKKPTVTVEKGCDVLLSGNALSTDEQLEILRKKARWIRDRIKQVTAISEDDIVSGSRIKYLVRRFLVVFEKIDNHAVFLSIFKIDNSKSKSIQKSTSPKNR